MSGQAELAEYLDEIRDQVCSRCVEKPPGGPPCAPLGKICGVERHLPELIDSIHDVFSQRIEPYLEHDREKICAHCPYLHSAICPCPMDYLLVLIVQAVESVDQRRPRTEAVVRFLPSKRLEGTVDAEAVRAVFAKAQGQWNGCDWDTEFGDSGLNLNAVRACDAEKKATEPEAEKDWQAAAAWLRRLEGSAREAEDEGTLAAAAADAGDWAKAAAHAHRAWALEFASGRALAKGFPLTWQPLRELTESGLNAASPLL